MRILQIVPEMKIGGVETGTLDLGRELVRRGHDSFIVSAGGQLVSTLEKDGVGHIELPVNRKSLWMIWRMSKKLRKIILDEKIDIVHARSRVPAWIGYFAVRGTRARFLTTAHGCYRVHFGSQVMTWGERVIAISQAIRNHLINNFSLHPSRITLIPRGVNLENFNFQPKPLPQDGVRIGIVGRLTPLKGHEYFLRAMRRVVDAFPQARGVVIGDASPSKSDYRDFLIHLRTELGLDPSIDFYPGSSEIPKIMNQLDILVLATTTPEAFGRVVIEAQALGVSVVGTSVGGVKEIIEEGQTGWLVPPVDEKALGEAIIHVLRNPNLIAEVVKKARRQVEEKFNLDLMVDRTLKVYEGLLRAPRILVIKLSAMGDIVLISPTLRALKASYPNSEITLLTHFSYRELVEHCPYLEGVIDVNFKNLFSKNFFKIIREVRFRRFDILLDLQNNKKSGLLGVSSRIPMRVGYARKGRGIFLTHRMRYAKNIGPIESQAKLLELMGVKMKDQHLEFWSSKDDELYIRDLLEGEGINFDQRLIAFFPFSNARWETKRWGLDRYMELASRTYHEMKAVPVFIGGSEDQNVRMILKDTLKVPFVDVIGRTSIGQLAELLRKCKALVSGDSAPLHIASAVGIPIIALFGPTDPRRHAPPGRVKILVHKVSCSPCYSPVCKIKTHDCLRQITVDRVLEAVKNILDTTCAIHNSKSVI